MQDVSLHHSAQTVSGALLASYSMCIVGKVARA
jgi:hypothetical protein